MTTTLFYVVAAALVDDQSRILLAQRPAGKSFAGLWEFAGGKLEDGETPEAALIRELHEELGVTVQEIDLSPLTFVSHPYKDKAKHMLMSVYLCRKWQGEPKALEHAELAWVRVEDLASYPMPEADIPVIAALQALL